MPLDNSRKIRGIQIFLIVFHGLILWHSVGLLAYVLAKVVSSGQSLEIIPIILGALFVIWSVLTIYATLYDKRVILIISGIILLVHVLSSVVVGIFVVMDMFQKGRQSQSGFEIALMVAFVLHLLLYFSAVLATFFLARHIKTKYALVYTYPF